VVRDEYAAADAVVLLLPLVWYALVRKLLVSRMPSAARQRGMCAITDDIQVLLLLLVLVLPVDSSGAVGSAEDAAVAADATAVVLASIFKSESSTTGSTCSSERSVLPAPFIIFLRFGMVATMVD